MTRRMMSLQTVPKLGLLMGFWLQIRMDTLCFVDVSSSAGQDFKETRFLVIL